MKLSGTGLMPFLERYAYPLYFTRKVLEDAGEQWVPLKELVTAGYVKHLEKRDLLPALGQPVFVLGSGISINDYDSAQWETISAGYSAGMNWWLLHDFVPNMYSVEYPHSKEVLKNEGPCHLESYLRMLDIRAEDYQDTLLMSRGSYQLNWYTRHGVPETHKSRLKMTISLNLRGDSLESVSRYTRWFARILRVNRALPFISTFFLPGLSASILYLVTLFYVIGVKKVVLCGVDLNHSKYFFQEEVPAARRTIEGWPIPLLGDGKRAHGTYSTRVNVKQKLLMLQHEFAGEGFQIYSGSPKSALVPEFPVYEW